MFDLNLLRQNPELIDQGQIKRGLTAFSKEALLIDTDYRQALTTLQTLQAERNQIAKQFGALKSKGEDTSELSKRSDEIKESMHELEATSKTLHDNLMELLSGKPNTPLEDVPLGADEAQNVCLRTWGEPKSFNFEPKAHYDLGEALGMLDFEQAALVCGPRFSYLTKDLARLERALASFFLDTHINEFGYTEVSTPVLMNDRAFYGTAQLPKFKDDQFQTTDGKWLIPSAEVSLTNMVAEKIVKEEELPMRLTAYTPCFRREAGSAGRDTRGMIRQHQFSKVELVSIVTAEQSAAEHERMTSIAEMLLQRLGLPYRVIALCTGDMGFQSQKTYDIEVWLPEQNTYREISSCSSCGDFQARRMNARFKRDGKNHFVHTLNGSGLPVGRTIVAILENYQNQDGSIEIPAVLRPYMGGKTIIS